MSLSRSIERGTHTHKTDRVVNPPDGENNLSVYVQVRSMQNLYIFFFSTQQHHPFFTG